VDPTPRSNGARLHRRRQPAPAVSPEGDGPFRLVDRKWNALPPRANDAKHRALVDVFGDARLCCAAPER
jgi:hypothetical protein